MPTKNPRVMVVLEPLLEKWLRKNAKTQGVSVSQAVRDIVRDAYREQEDAHWVRQAESRLATLEKSRVVSHKDAWKD
jgi:hypothetical protein